MQLAPPFLLLSFRFFFLSFFAFGLYSPTSSFLPIDFTPFLFRWIDFSSLFYFSNYLGIFYFSFESWTVVEFRWLLLSDGFQNYKFSYHFRSTFNMSNVGRTNRCAHIHAFFHFIERETTSKIPIPRREGANARPAVSNDSIQWKMIIQFRMFREIQQLHSNM